MPSPEERVACVRCGDFVAATGGPGVTVCPRCLEGERTAPFHIWVKPPGDIFWIRYRPVLMLAVLGAVLGAAGGGVLAFFAAGAVARALLVGSVALSGALSLGFVAFVALAVFRPHRGHARWKAALLESLLFLGGKDDPGVSLVYYVSRRIELLDITLPVEPGLLLETASGLVFFGAEGARVHFPTARVRGVAMERLVMMPPRQGVRLDLDDGSPVFFVFMEEMSYRRNKALAMALGERLRARVPLDSPRATKESRGSLEANGEER